LDDGTRLPVKGVFIEFGSKGVPQSYRQPRRSDGSRKSEVHSYHKKQETTSGPFMPPGISAVPLLAGSHCRGQGAVAGLEAASLPRSFAVTRTLIQLPIEERQASYCRPRRKPAHGSFPHLFSPIKVNSMVIRNRYRHDGDRHLGTPRGNRHRSACDVLC